MNENLTMGLDTLLNNAKALCSGETDRICCLAGFQHLQLNKSSKYRRNAVFFCQIPLSFTLYMLYNYGGLYLIWR